MNTQQAYEKMRKYLTRPGARRCTVPNSDYPGDTSCAYTAKIEGHTHHCAVGCLLNSNAWKQIKAAGANNMSLSRIMDLPTVQPLLVDVDKIFLLEAQRIHDNTFSWENGEFDVKRLDALARKFRLAPPKV